MKLSHENQSKKGRNCSDVALGGGLGGMGTVDGILPLITTGGMEGNAGGAVDVDDVVAVEAVVVGEVRRGLGSRACAAEEECRQSKRQKSMRVVDMIDSFTLGVSEESKSLPHPICVHLRKGFYPQMTQMNADNTSEDPGCAETKRSSRRREAERGRRPLKSSST